MNSSTVSNDATDSSLRVTSSRDSHNSKIGRTTVIDWNASLLSTSVLSALSIRSRANGCLVETRCFRRTNSNERLDPVIRAIIPHFTLTTPPIDLTLITDNSQKVDN